MLTLWVAPPKMCREFHTQQQLFAVYSLKVCGLFSSEFAKFTFLFKTTSVLFIRKFKGHNISLPRHTLRLSFLFTT